MATAQATLNELRQSPRKVRLVANFMKGKTAESALANLAHVDKRAAGPLAKLLRSALANAKDLNIDIENLVVDRITVDGGPILYRRKAGARGRGMPIRKRTSKITLVLAEKEGQKKARKAAAKAEPATAEKPVKEAKAEKPAVAKKPRAKKATK